MLAAGVSIPSTARHADFVSLTAALPSVEPPAFLGLPANAARALRGRAAAQLRRSLRLLSKDGGDGEKAVGTEGRDTGESLTPA